jgi:hypothetical protein
MDDGHAQEVWMVRPPRRSLAALLMPAALAACGDATPRRTLDTLDAELRDSNATGNMHDPAMRAALPARPKSEALTADGVAASGKSVSRAATSEKLKSTPAATGECPGCKVARESLTLGALASRQKTPGTGACAAKMQYSMRWAALIPGDLPLYPDARVTEAAGNNDGGCKIRAVSFASSAPLQNVLDYYYTRASNAGYSAEHQVHGAEHVLGGTRARDDAALAVFLTSRADGGTNVDIVANNGR